MTTQKPQEQQVAPKQQELVPIDQVAVIRSRSTGEIRLMKSTVVLSVRDGTLVNIPGMSKKVGNDWLQVFLVSADGYKLQARASGLEVVNAPTVIVDGVEQKNPHVERDPKTGRPRMVHCRAMCYGHTKFGKPVRSDRTAVLDLDIYRLTDLMAKAKKQENAADFKVLPADAPSPGKEWARYPIDDAVTLWVNTTAGEFLKWQAESVNRVKKALELCQSFAQRNAIHHHPSITVHKSEGVAALPVTCWCWVPERGSTRWDGTQYDVMVGKLLEGGVEYTDAKEAPAVEVKAGTDVLTDEPREVIDAEATAEGDETDIPTGEEEEGRQTDQQKRQTTVCSQIKTMSVVKPKEFTDICSRVGIDVSGGEAWEMASFEKQLAIHDALSKLLGSVPPDGVRGKKGAAK